MRNSYHRSSAGVDRESPFNNRVLGQNPRGSGLAQIELERRCRREDRAERILHARLDAVSLETDTLDLKPR
jgi:hypothetical protein